MTLTEKTDLRGSLENADNLAVLESLDAELLAAFFDRLDEDDAETVVRLANGDDRERPVPSEYFADPSPSHAALRALSDAIGYHGTEAIRKEGWKPIYEYANSGDSYAPELFYSVDLEVWILGTFADLVQADDRI